MLCKHEGHFLTLLGAGSQGFTSVKVSEMLKNEDYTSFIAAFINGLVHQTNLQTGSSRPVGETTAIRIAHELITLICELKGVEKIEFDWSNFHGSIRLDVL